MASGNLFEDQFYSNLFEKIDQSPKRGRIRPKSASFKNIYRPNKVLHRSFSGKCILDKFKKDETEKYKTALLVQEREQFMKDRLCACINEATAYSKVLGELNFYQIHLKLEDEHTADISLAKYLASVRYDQIFVEIVKLRPSETDKGHLKRIMSAERFFEEHARIYSEIKKRRSLMPKIIASKERLQEKVVLSSLSHHASHKWATSIDKDKRFPVSFGFNDTTRDDITDKLDCDVNSLTKELAHEKLRKILRACMNATSKIETQLVDIKSRGWNLS